MKSYASSLTAVACMLLGNAAFAQETAISEPRVIGVPAVPPPPPHVFSSLREEALESSGAGVEGGEVYFQDPAGRIRFYPSARLTLDGNVSPGAPSLGGDPSGNGLGASFFVRRAGFEVSGELRSRLFFTLGFELGGGRIGNTDYVGDGTTRFARASAHTGRLLPADAHITLDFRRWLNVTAGQQLLPYSMSNRTPDTVHELPERPLAIRAFAAPWHRDLGVTVWGEAAPKEYLHYEVGVFSGDGYEHPFADALPEFAGRIHSRPFSGMGSDFLLSKAQVGVSARVGSRDPSRVAYDYPTVASGQGFVLWQPGYIDSLGRTTHVLPSGVQRAFGAELRLPFQLPEGRGLDLQSEVHYVENDTREAVAGYVTTNSERFGRIQGVGWYAQLSFWCCGNAYANGDVGEVKPKRLDLDVPAAKRPALRRGVELLALASGIDANYDGATREGSTKDAKTPRSNVKVFQLGGGAQYWFGRNFRGGVFYSGYLAPNAGTPKNLVVMPGNVPDAAGAVSGSPLLHEVTLRLAAGF